MKSLEEEALEYIDNNVFCDGITPFELEIADKAFIAGANSKWVQADKIKAQIKIVQVIDLEISKKLSINLSFDETIKKLQQQLKELDKWLEQNVK